MNRPGLILTVAIFNSLLVVSHSFYDSYKPQCGQVVTVKVGQGSNAPYGYVEFPVKDMPYNCASSVNLEAIPEYQLTLRFQYMKLDCYGGSYVNISGRTNTHIYNCGWWSNYPVLYTTSNFVNVTFVKGLTTSANEAVSLHYTAFHTGSCYGEFQCAYSGRCIPSEVSCDGIDNCGDWYDESVWACGLTTAMIIAISISSAVAGLSILLCVALSVSKRNKARRARTADDTNNGTQSRGHVAADHQNEAAEQVDLKTIAIPGPPPYTYTNCAMVTVDGELPTPYHEVDGFGMSPPMYETMLGEKPEK